MNRYLGTVLCETTALAGSWRELLTHFKSLNQTPHCWVESSLTGKVLVMTEDENRSIARIDLRKRTVGALIHFPLEKTIEVYGHSEKVSGLAAEYAEYIGAAFHEDENGTTVESDEPSCQMVLAMVEGNSKEMRRLIKSGVSPDGYYPPEELGEDEGGLESIRSVTFWA